MKKLILFLTLIPCCLKAQVVSITAISATSNLWPAANAIDNDNSTIWSSNARVNQTDVESITISFGNKKIINYIKFMPRYVNNSSYGFPLAFSTKYMHEFIIAGKTVKYWIPVRTETSYPVPVRNDYIILPFTETVYTSSISVDATLLGKDNIGNNIFQLAEIEVGYEPNFATNFSYLGNNSQNGVNEIRNVGSNNFDPDKLSIWHTDTRKPFISSTNIYAPSIVKNGTTWNIYYGGWISSSQVNDNIYMTTTTDNFLTTSGFATVISNINYEHANNGTVIKTGVNDWKMLYTTYPNSNKNKPCYGVSTDGLNWAFNNLITMTGYPNWSNADVNGGNVLFYENNLYHMFFTDMLDLKVYHATSTNFINYTYQNVALNKTRVPQDLKSFTFNTAKHYLLGTHFNTNNIELTISQNINAFPTTPTITLATSSYLNDKFITSLGFVADSSRLYGLLYGSSSISSLTDNKIYASWLQKKVIFKNDYVQWGDVEEAYGPDRVKLYMNTQVETGKFYIYDSDGITLLYTSPRVTIKSGDMWNYKKQSTPIMPTIDHVSKKEKVQVQESSSKPHIIQLENEFYVHLNLQEETATTIELIKMNGTLVNRQNWNLAPGSNKLLLNTIGFEKGVYIVKITCSKQDICILKLII